MNRSRTSVGAAIGLVVAALTVGAGAPPASAADKAKVLGGGSSFSALLIDQWRADTRSKPYSLDVNYQATGSSQGRQSFWQGTIDFAQTDIPYQPDEAGAGQVPAAGTFRYVTTVAGALGMMYNLTDDAGNRITELNLDSRQVCRIFTEPLVSRSKMFWDDPEIAALNPDIFLPNKPIQPVVRSDGSGTSYVLAEYCIATQPQVWAAFRTAAMADAGTRSQAMQDGRPVSNWPAGSVFTAAAQSTGIANSVSATEGAITYIEAGYNEITNLPLARVRNANGNFVEPTPQGITVALKYASIRADGTFELDFLTRDPAAYFPSTYSYTVVRTTGIDEGKGRTVAEFIYYAMTVGQDQAEPLKFARLSDNLIADALQAAAAIPGATPFADWQRATGVVAVVVGDGGGSTGGGSTGGGSTGGGSTGGGSTGGGSTGGGSAGGDAGGGSTGGGSTGGGSTGGGSTGGGSTGGGSTGGGSAGGASTGGTGSTVAGATTTTTANAAGGRATATTVRGSGATGSGSASADGGGTEQALPPVDGNAPVVASGAAAAAAIRKAPGPSNAEALWTFLQGAALVGAGLALRRGLAGVGQ